jgi:hypothetical protein
MKGVGRRRNAEGPTWAHAPPETAKVAGAVARGLLEKSGAVMVPVPPPTGKVRLRLNEPSSVPVTFTEVALGIQPEMLESRMAVPVTVVPVAVSEKCSVAVKAVILYGGGTVAGMAVI